GPCAWAKSRAPPQHDPGTSGDFAHPTAAASIRPRIAAAVDQQVLTGDEAGVGGAQECAISAELGRAAVAARRVGGGALAPELLEARAAALQQRAHMPLLGVAVEDAGQQIVDGDVARHRLAGEPADEADQARAGAVRERELELRNLHAARDDVD